MGYGEAPWIFKGRALYQLNIVKSEEARKYVPDNFKLVEMFGYTLGGFYLARYDDSPVGAFEELVALAGLVWNAPTSCAWAARVYVNNKEARDHGLQSVGLPSRLASFSEVPIASAAQEIASAAGKAKLGMSWWRQRSKSGAGASTSGQGASQGLPLHIRNVDTRRGRKLDVPVCTLLLPAAKGEREFAGPRITLSLPSFSGGTPDFPALLKYSCNLLTNVRVVPPALVCVPEQQQGHGGTQQGGAGGLKDGGELMSKVLGGRPLMALAFDDMEMTVHAPLRVDMPVLAQYASQPASVAGAQARGAR